MCDNVARHEALTTLYNNLAMGFLDKGNNHLFVEYRLGESEISNRMHAMVGRWELMYLGRLFTIKLEMGIID